MSDIHIRQQGRAGHITLNRPQALNALTHDMCRQIATALTAWETDNSIALILIDSAGDKAFCAGGDIAELYAQGIKGNYDPGRAFWRDEYRMNAQLAEYPKPIISFLQGFTMGGGVGLGCHVAHRIVGDSTQIAMPECAIGLVPDVGGTALLAGAPGHLGEYLGLTGARMTAGDAIYTGFADHYVPLSDWPALKSALCETGDSARIPNHSAPPAPLADQRADIDAAFGAATLDAISDSLTPHRPIAATATKALARNAPLAMALALALIRRQRPTPNLRDALQWEYRCTWRAQPQGDFLEGIRAQIIDKDRKPIWYRAPTLRAETDCITEMLAPLGPDALTF